MAKLRKRTRHARAKPGAQGGDRFFHVEVRPPRDFVIFRVHDVGAGAVSSASPAGGRAAHGTRRNG